jgi:DIS3-like exonuclease 2
MFGGACVMWAYFRYEWHQVAHDVRLLHTLSQRIRQRRFALGSLRLDNTKILFRMDGDGNPCEALPYITKDSNHLVEEFMLLANRRVAKFIADVFPQRAVLRRHPPPDARKLDGLRKFCEQHGLQLDLSSAGALHASLQLVRDAALAAGDPGLAEVVTLQVGRSVCACTRDTNEGG